MRCSAHTIKHSDFLPPLPRCFVSSLRGTAMRLGLRSRGRKTLRPRAWGCSPDPQTGFLTETTGPPRFLEDPAMNVPCSSTPAGPLRSATAALWCCLPPFGRRRLPRLSAFRGSITRPAHSLSTLRRVDCSTTTQDSLPDGWPTLSGRDWLPAGSHRKVSGHPILLSQASPGAPK